MTVPNRVERWHARMVRVPFLRLGAAVTRVLLALAFTPSGFVKLVGDRFTTMPATTPVGFFFEGFFSATAYYQFVGAMQLLAAALLLFPATAPLGAAIYLPIIVNIFVITASVGFSNTIGVAGLMLIANLFLLFWDFDRWAALLPGSSAARPARHLGAAGTWALYLAMAIGFLGVTRLHLARLRHTSMIGPAFLVAGGALLGLAALWSARRALAASTSSSAPVGTPIGASGPGEAPPRSRLRSPEGGGS
jgi:hypothetical protein